METLVRVLIICFGSVILIDLLLTVIVLVAFRAYVLRWLKRHPNEIANQQLPPAAVIVALRGPDPGLSDTLTSLVNQNYPDFVVHLVIDSETDPVLEDAR